MKAKQTLPAIIGSLLALFILSAWAIASKQSHVRSGNGLCEEVYVELGESVRLGLLESEEALEVLQRCYDRFGENSYAEFP